MNALLADFLNSTSAGYDGVWSDDHQALLTEAQTALPPALDAHEATLARIPECKGFDPTIEFTDTLARGKEFAAQARKRLANAPELLAHMKARKELETWRQAQGAAKHEARTTTCGKKKNVTIYYASEDETGRREWHYCDGARVGQPSGEGPAFLPEEGKGKAKKRQLKPYLEAASRYPVEKFSRAPRLPEKPKDAPAEAEETIDLDQPVDP